MVRARRMSACGWHSAATGVHCVRFASLAGCASLAAPDGHARALRHLLCLVGRFPSWPFRTHRRYLGSLRVSAFCRKNQKRSNCSKRRAADAFHHRACVFPTCRCASNAAPCVSVPAFAPTVQPHARPLLVRERSHNEAQIHVCSMSVFMCPPRHAACVQTYNVYLPQGVCCTLYRPTIFYWSDIRRSPLFETWDSWENGPDILQKLDHMVPGKQSNVTGARAARPTVRGTSFVHSKPKCVRRRVPARPAPPCAAPASPTLNHNVCVAGCTDQKKE